MVTVRDCPATFYLKRYSYCLFDMFSGIGSYLVRAFFYVSFVIFYCAIIFFLRYSILAYRAIVGLLIDALRQYCILVVLI